MCVHILVFNTNSDNSKSSAKRQSLRAFGHRSRTKSAFVHRFLISKVQPCPCIMKQRPSSPNASSIACESAARLAKPQSLAKQAQESWTHPSSPHCNRESDSQTARQGDSVGDSVGLASHSPAQNSLNIDCAFTIEHCSSLDAPKSTSSNCI